MSGHTPGPWRICAHFPDMVQGGPRDRLIARADVTDFTGEEYKEQNKANARLIAAAPDLLEAAKSILPYLDLMWPPEDATGQRHGLRAALQAAVAKAEGK